jgi:hypothetical protein
VRNDRTRFGILVLAMGLLGCGGSINSNTGPDGSTTAACASLGACACMAASDRCTVLAESCWCPSACDPSIACVCGGGRFLGCEDNALVGSCTGWLSAVQNQCAGQPFVPDIGDLCTTAANPNCVSSCLANLKYFGQCSEIDCSFCPVCDCAPPAAQSPFATCIASCRMSPPAGN